MPSKKGVAELLTIMRRGEFYSSQDAAKTLARIGKLAVPALKEACSFPGYAIAAFANEALEPIDDPEAGPALVQAVREGFPGAILSLGRMKTQATEVGSTISFTGKRFYSDLRAVLRRIATPRARDWLEVHKANERKKGRRNEENTQH